MAEKVALIVVTFTLLALDLVFTVIKLTTLPPSHRAGGKAGVSPTKTAHAQRRGGLSAWTVIELLNTGIFIATLAIHIHIMLKTNKVRSVKHRIHLEKVQAAQTTSN